MEPLNYIGEIMSDGHISLPQYVAAILNLKPQSQIKVTLFNPEGVLDSGEFLKVAHCVTVLKPKNNHSTKGTLHHEFFK